MPATSFPAYITYTDPALAYDPAAKYEPVYGPGSDFARRDMPAPASIRPLAEPLTLPAVITVHYYVGGAGGAHPTWFHADLDPAANNGYTHGSFSVSHPENRGFTVSATRPGDVTHGALHPCPKCGDPWCRTDQEAWGNATDCDACGYHNFYSIGD
jgi:hypothetical protein